MEEIYQWWLKEKREADPNFGKNIDDEFIKCVWGCGFNCCKYKNGNQIDVDEYYKE